jgi:hypothetical protein
LHISQAEQKILRQRSTPKWARKSRLDFAEALKNIDKLDLALSKKGVRSLAKSWILDAFKPYASFIARKLAMKQMRAEASEEYDKLLDQLGSVKEPDAVQAIVRRMSELEEQLQNERMIAFQSHKPEIQDRFIAAADYCDEFINLGPGFSLRAWYLWPAFA